MRKLNSSNLSNIQFFSFDLKFYTAYFGFPTFTPPHKNH